MMMEQRDGRFPLSFPTPRTKASTKRAIIINSNWFLLSWKGERRRRRETSAEWNFLLIPREHLTAFNYRTSWAFQPSVHSQSRVHVMICGKNERQLCWPWWRQSWWEAQFKCKTQRLPLWIWIAELSGFRLHQASAKLNGGSVERCRPNWIKRSSFRNWAFSS